MADRRVDLAFTPYAHQRAAHALLSIARFLVLVWHRGAGKTVFAIIELVLAALGAARKDARFGYICPFLKQAKGVAWDYLKGFAIRVPGSVINEGELSVRFGNGATVRLFGSDNPDALRGIHFDGVVLDEVADMRPNVWGEIIRPALTDRTGWAIFIGTPKGVNLFSDLYYRALKGEEGWAVDMRRASETGALKPGELEKAKREMTASQYAQEMECDFGASVDNALLKLDEVLAAQRRVIVESQYAHAAKVLGIDVARYGDDRTVFFPRQGLAGMRPRVLRDLSTMDVASQAAFSIDKWKPDAVFVDAGGLGAGVVDRLQQLGHAVIGIDFGGRALDVRFENRRAEMWCKTADWVKAGGCLPDMQELTAELTAPTYTYANARGRFQLESKDDMRARGLKSPDVADSLVLTFAAPVMPRSMFAGGGQRVVHEYDPFANPMGPGYQPSGSVVHDYDPFDRDRRI